MQKYLIASALEAETQGLEDYAPVIHTGVGKINAAIHLYEAALHYKPELIINYGTAGAIADHSGLHKIDTFIQHDIDVRGLGIPRGVTPFANDEQLPNKKGMVLGTGDIFITDKARQLEGLGIELDLIDMEAFAMREVCLHLNIPFLSYKYVTDGGDEDAGDNWEANVAKGAQQFKQVLEKEFGRSHLI